MYFELVKYGYNPRQAKIQLGIKNMTGIGFSYDKFQNELDLETNNFKRDSVLDLVSSNLKHKTYCFYHGAINPKKKEVNGSV